MVDDLGDVIRQRYRPDPDHPDAGNVAEALAAATAVAERVAPALASGADVLVLGGDCTVELGTVAGAAQDGSSIGLIYIDLDGDLNTPESADGILDWMGLAHLLGVPGSVPELVALGARSPLLAPDQVYLVAVERLTEAEQRTVDQLRLRRASLADVSDQLPEVVADVTAWAQDFDRVLVHVDIDVLDYRQFPIAEEVREVPGLSFPQLAELTAAIGRLPNARTFTICEINPDHAREDTQFDDLVRLITDAVSARS